MGPTDPYVILGIDKTATRDQIDAAYREKAKKYHPDVGGDAWAFRLVQQAYDLLTEGMPNTQGPRKPQYSGGRVNQGPTTDSTRPKEGGSSPGEKAESECHSSAQTSERAPRAGRQQPTARPIDRGTSSPSKTPPASPRWWNNLVFKVVFVYIVTGSGYSLWDTYDFLSVAKTTQAWLTADPEESYVGSGNPLGTSHYRISIEYSFWANGRVHKGRDSFSDKEAHKFNERLRASG